MKLYMKNRNALEKIFKKNSIKNKCVRDQSWLELHNWIVDLNQDYLYYEERNGDDTLITNGVISSYIAKENRKETLEERLDEYFLIEKDFKHQRRHDFMKSFAPERKLVVTFGFFDIPPDTISGS